MADVVKKGRRAVTGLAGSKTLRALWAAAIATLALLAGAADAHGAQSDQPQVAVDDGGNAYFTWRRFDGTDIVKTRKRNANGSLGAVQDLSAAGQNARAPRVALDPQGNAYFIWLRSNGSNTIAQTRKRNANGSLSAVQDLSAPGQSADEPEVAVDPQGNAYFTWRRSNGSHFIIQGRKRNANGTLSAVQDLSAPGQSAFDPQVAVDSQGNAYFTWQRFDGFDFIVQFRRRAANGALGSVQGLSAPGEGANESGVAVDSQGNAYFAWRRSNGSNTIIQTRRRAASGGLSAVQDLSVAGGNAQSPELAVDPQGDAVFGWEREGVIQTRWREASGVLSPVQDLAGTGGSLGRPRVAVDPTGTASFVWQAFDATPSEIVRTRRRTAEGLLSPEQDLSATAASAEQQQLGVDPQGNAYFVWKRSDIIQTRRRAPDGSLTAVQNLTG